MQKRTFVKLIMAYLILITLIALGLGTLLFFEFKPSSVYVCQNGLATRDPNGCPIELNFNKPGEKTEKTIFLNAESGKRFETCILNLSGSALENNVTLDIGDDETIDTSIILFKDIGKNGKNSDRWSKGQNTGNTTITISDNFINHSFKNANVSWIQYDFEQGIDATKYSKFSFWSKCSLFNSSSSYEDFKRWNVLFLDSAKKFKCNVLDYDIQYEDGTWKYHSNDFCPEAKISDLRYIKIIIDQSNSMSATCLYNDLKFIKPTVKELNIDSEILNKYLYKNNEGKDKNKVPIKISSSGKGSLIIKLNCILSEPN